MDTACNRNSETGINIYMLITKLQFNGLLGKDLAQVINKKNQKTSANSAQKQLNLPAQLKL